MREIEEEGAILVGLDKGDSFFGIALGEVVLNDRVFNRILVAAEHDGPHVIGVEDTEVVVEAMAGRVVLGQVAQVPLAHNLGGVALVFEKLGQGGFAGFDPVVASGVGGGVAGDARSERVASGQQCHPGGSATGCGNIETGQAGALGSHAVEVRRLIVGLPVAGEGSPAEIVGVDDDDVWPLRGRMNCEL